MGDPICKKVGFLLCYSLMNDELVVISINEILSFIKLK